MSMTVLDRTGSKGGDVRSVDEAAALHRQYKARYVLLISETIYRALIRNGTASADDCAELDIPPEHHSLIGTTFISLKSRGVIEPCGEKVAQHKAANSRRIKVWQFTDQGRKVIAGVGGETKRAEGANPRKAPPRAERRSPDPGASLPRPKPPERPPPSLRGTPSEREDALIARCQELVDAGEAEWLDEDLDAGQLEDALDEIGEAA